jgi:hypothetical protein
MKAYKKKKMMKMVGAGVLFLVIVGVGFLMGELTLFI